jgi:hypothetical protein
MQKHLQLQYHLIVQILTNMVRSQTIPSCVMCLSPPLFFFFHYWLFCASMKSKSYNVLLINFLTPSNTLKSFGIAQRIR